VHGGEQQRHVQGVPGGGARAGEGQCSCSPSVYVGSIGRNSRRILSLSLSADIGTGTSTSTSTGTVLCGRRQDHQRERGGPEDHVQAHGGRDAAARARHGSGDGHVVVCGVV
jgi:hypothetical protein